MTKSQAIELLKCHSYNHSDLNHPKMETGFLGMLRPYRGILYEENFHEIMAILKILAPDFRNDKIDREIINAFWGICYFAKSWGTDPDGMLRRNNIIDDDQVMQLIKWIDCISYTVAMLLDGVDDDAAFDIYMTFK